RQRRRRRIGCAAHYTSSSPSTGAMRWTWTWRASWPPPHERPAVAQLGEGDSCEWVPLVPQISAEEISRRDRFTVVYRVRGSGKPHKVRLRTQSSKKALW